MWKPRQTQPPSFATASFLFEHVSFGQQNQFHWPSHSSSLVTHLQNFQIATSKSRSVRLRLFLLLHDGDFSLQGRMANANLTTSKIRDGDGDQRCGKDEQQRRSELNNGERYGRMATEIKWVRDLLF
ncbi:hypothetical protein ACOSP7_024105 [Xanthoceras sorbifolium]